MSAEKVRVKIRVWPAITAEDGFDYGGKRFLWMCYCCGWGEGVAQWADAVARADAHARSTWHQGAAA